MSLQDCEKQEKQALSNRLPKARTLPNRLPKVRTLPNRLPKARISRPQLLLHGEKYATPIKPTGLDESLILVSTLQEKEKGY